MYFFADGFRCVGASQVTASAVVGESGLASAALRDELGFSEHLFFR